MYLVEIYATKNEDFSIKNTIERANILNRLMFNATLFFQRDAAILVRFQLFDIRG